MAEIKRLRYFTEEFLLADDFTAEQAYHMEMRRRHNRACHGFGVAEGLRVTAAGNNQVRIQAGMAIDGLGREIVLVDELVYTLRSTSFPLFLTIAYDEVHDPADRSPQEGIDDFIRWTERPSVQESATQPTDRSKVTLARILPGVAGTVVVENTFAPRFGFAGFTVTSTKNVTVTTPMAPNTPGQEIMGDVSFPVAAPQFLLVSLVPSPTDGKVSWVPRVARTGNDALTYGILVKNESTNLTVNSVALRMQTIALAGG